MLRTLDIFAPDQLAALVSTDQKVQDVGFKIQVAVGVSTSVWYMLFRV